MDILGNISESLGGFSDSMSGLSEKFIRAGAIAEGKGATYDNQRQANRLRERNSGFEVEDRQRKQDDQLAEQREEASLKDMSTISMMLENEGNEGRVLELLRGRAEAGESLGGSDMRHTKRLLDMAETGDFDNIKSIVDGEVEQAYRFGLMKRPGGDKNAAIDRLKFLMKGLPEDKAQQILSIAAGLSPRAGSSAAERMGQDQSLSGQVAQSQGQITGARERAKLQQQSAYQPRIAGDVATQSAQAKQDVQVAGDERERTRGNKEKLRNISSQINAMGAAFQNAWTNPVAGVLPAITEDQQIAQASVDQMLPAIKSMFRTPGEGALSDKEQAAFAGIMPSRFDYPSVVKLKLGLLNRLINVKLNKGAGFTTDEALNFINRGMADVDKASAKNGGANTGQPASSSGQSIREVEVDF